MKQHAINLYDILIILTISAKFYRSKSTMSVPAPDGPAKLSRRGRLIKLPLRYRK